MIVLKFGGTSVGSAALIDKALDLAINQINHAPLIVSSAITKVTDALIQIADLSKSASQEDVLRAVESLHQIHDKIATDLLGKDAGPCLADLQLHFQELAGITRGLCLIREVSKRSRDAIVSFGERLATIILYHRALKKGISCEYLDAREVVKTDENFNSANLEKELTYALILQKVHPRKGHLIITQGFIGSTQKGVTSTLGRGGSDWSATIFGAALHATEVQIWTDVDGIMSTDPRIVPSAKVIDEISYAEAAELSYFGAKVIHPATIMPAVELNIPVWVKNTQNPSQLGTKIHISSSHSGIQAIAGKKGITLVTIRSTRMLNAYGFLRSIFQVFEDHKTSVDLIATSEVSVSITIDDQGRLPSIKRELQRFAEVEVEDNKAIICMVGKNLWKDSAFISKAFLAMQSFPVRLVSLGSSDINLSVVVPQEHLEHAIRTLHDSLFN